MLLERFDRILHRPVLIVSTRRRGVRPCWMIFVRHKFLDRMPAAFDEHFFGIGGTAKAMGVEARDDEVEGRGADGLQVPIDAGPCGDLGGGAVKVGDCNVVWHAQTGLGEPAFYWEFVNKQGVGSLALEPGNEVFFFVGGRGNEGCAAIGLGQVGLPIERSSRPE